MSSSAALNHPVAQQNVSLNESVDFELLTSPSCHYAVKTFSVHLAYQAHTPRAHPDNMDHVTKTAQDQLQEPGFTVPQIQISLSFCTWDQSKKKKSTIYGLLLI